jgi:Domain found in Dishevelled, Egl-10, and Pleckstrin (DEP)
MLLLKEDRVQFQEVINPESDRAQPFIGVFYQGKFFEKLKSFPREQFESAQQRMRQLSLNKEAVYLLLEESEDYTIWCQQEKLELYNVKGSKDWISGIDLKSLVSEMRDINGIKIQDRRYRLVVYPRCFVGSEATIWLVHRFGIYESEAVELGQRLIDDKLMHHVANDHPFKNGHFFYRFYWDE